MAAPSRPFGWTRLPGQPRLGKALADPISTSSPIVIPSRPRQVVFQTGLRVVSVDATDGKLLWDHPLAESPLDSLGALLWTGEVLLSSSVHFGGRGLRLEKKDNRIIPTELWLNAKLGSYYHSAVSIGAGHYVMLTNTPAPGAHLCYVEARTGKVKWSEPNVADWHAGLIRTGDGRLLLCDGKGALRLIEATPEKCRELARADVGLTSSSNPVLANGRLYLRDRKQDLICLEFER